MKSKKILIIILLASLSISIFAQNSYITGRMNSKISYSKYPYLGVLVPDKFDPCFVYEMNYGVTKILELGGYTGFSMYETFKGPIVIGQIYSPVKRGISMYGLNLNFHLLPFFLKLKESRIDLYASTKIGGIHHWKRANDAYPEKNKEIFDYGFYAGTAFYLSKQLGIYGEYGFGNNTKWRAGLSYKFKRK